MNTCRNGSYYGEGWTSITCLNAYKRVLYREKPLVKALREAFPARENKTTLISGPTIRQLNITSV